MKLYMKNLLLIIGLLAGLIVLAFIQPDFAVYLFILLFLTLPYQIFKSILMGKKKRNLTEQMKNEINEMYLALGKVAYDNCNEGSIFLDIVEPKVDLNGVNRLFIRKDVKSYLESRNLFNNFVNEYFLDSNGLLLEKCQKEIDIQEAEALVTKLLENRDSI